MLSARPPILAPIRLVLGAPFVHRRPRPRAFQRSDVAAGQCPLLCRRRTRQRPFRECPLSFEAMAPDTSLNRTLRAGWLQY